MKYLLFLLAGCASPDYVELSPYAGVGSLSPRGTDDVDMDNMGAMVTVGWSLGLQRDAYHAMDRMRFTDRNALWTDAKEPPPLPVIAQDPETGEEMSLIPDAPETYEDAWVLLIYAVAAAVASWAALHFAVPAWKSWKANGKK